jgi:hypothetical protein
MIWATLPTWSRRQACVRPVSRANQIPTNRLKSIGARLDACSACMDMPPKFLLTHSHPGLDFVHSNFLHPQMTNHALWRMPSNVSPPSRTVFDMPGSPYS